MNRLTGERFRELLEKHPDFDLMIGQWCKIGSPCSGCAMTLAFMDSNPDVDLGVMGSADRVLSWAEQEYGNSYKTSFIHRFDHGDKGIGHDIVDRFADMYGNLWREANHDAIDCLTVARELDRL